MSRCSDSIQWQVVVGVIAVVLQMPGVVIHSDRPDGKFWEKRSSDATAVTYDVTRIYVKYTPV